MRKEHIKTAVVIALSTSVLIAGAYLLMPDKYKDKARDKVLGLFKKKKEIKKEEPKKKEEKQEEPAMTVYKNPELNPAIEDKNLKTE